MAIKNTIGIFTGKQRVHNIQVLTILYDNEPLTAWELTAKLTKTGKQSLHATLNKRLRSLEKKEYVRRRGKKWHLRYKGILAVLLIQRKPKMWNPKWTTVFEENAQVVAEQSAPLLRVNKATTANGIKSLGLCLDDFDTWINLSKKAKEMMENGIINFDIIKDTSLLMLITKETMTIEQLSNLFKEKPTKE
jgi:predicted transcriptional regulator